VHVVLLGLVGLLIWVAVSIPLGLLVGRWLQVGAASWKAAGSESCACPDFSIDRVAEASVSIAGTQTGQSPTGRRVAHVTARHQGFSA
jgi:hypothetical protein